MNPLLEYHQLTHTRRQFFGDAGLRLGGLGAGTAARRAAWRAPPRRRRSVHPPLPGFPHFAPKAKALIYLHMNGGAVADRPVGLQAEAARVLRQGPARQRPQRPADHHHDQRPGAVSRSPRRCSSSRSTASAARWVSELLPHTADIVDDIALVKTVHTNAINHDPACTFVMTGSEVPGKPSIGSWLAYGLGSESNDLPAFVVFTPHFPRRQQRPGALHAHVDAAASCPRKYNGVALRGVGDPVLYVQNPAGRRPRRPPRHARRARTS